MKNTISRYRAYTIILLFFSVSRCFSAIPKDSLRFDELRKRITALETDNKILSEKINAVNMANDKILGAFYVLIGAVISMILAVIVYNAIHSWKLDKAKLAEIKDTIFNELQPIVAENINKKVSKEISSVKDDIKVNEYDILTLNIRLLIKDPAFKDYYLYIPREGFYEAFADILKMSVKQENMVSWRGSFIPIQDILEHIPNIMKDRPKISLENKKELYDAIKEVPKGSNDTYVIEALKSLGM